MKVFGGHNMRGKQDIHSILGVMILLLMVGGAGESITWGQGVEKTT
ncbi:Uncharacterised protein [uncultured archaeon]|nr:Uncharacterised protein [uncultured archaeon]